MTLDFATYSLSFLVINDEVLYIYLTVFETN